MTDLTYSADLGLEGIVSKRANSAYRSGRSKDWLKIKCFTESDFVVIGTDRDNRTGALRALLAREDMTYAGAAFIAMSGDDRERLLQSLKHRAAKVSPLPRLRIKGADWCKPEIRVRVKHLAGSDGLRHATVRQTTND